MADLPNLPNPEKAVEGIYSAAQANAVFAEPVVAGPYTVITASEVAAGGGFGFGQGMGPGVSSGEAAPGGGGGGGGGGSMGRPVAVITIGPDGVTVKPILDVTKIALAGATTWAAMAASVFKLVRRRRG